jgi:hypothetical protein
VQGVDEMKRQQSQATLDDEIDGIVVDAVSKLSEETARSKNQAWVPLSDVIKETMSKQYQAEEVMMVIDRLSSGPQVRKKTESKEKGSIHLFVEQRRLVMGSEDTEAYCINVPNDMLEPLHAALTCKDPIGKTTV